jgi:cytochrome P450
MRSNGVRISHFLLICIINLLALSFKTSENLSAILTNGFLQAMMAGTIQALGSWISGTDVLSIRGATLFLSLLVTIQIIGSVIRIVYNLYFHPLSRYPGPKLWAAFDVARTIGRMGGYIDFQIAEEHRKHGEVVRIGVDELSFINPSAWKDIYGHGHAELRKYFPPNAVNPNQIIAANSSSHFRMRRAMLPAFSEKALAQQERLVRVYIDLLMKRLSECAQSGNPADMARWYNLTTFDLIADLCFGKSLDGLETGRSNAWIEKIDKMLRIMPVLMLMTSFPLFMTLFNLVLGRTMQQSRKEHQDYAASLAMSRIQGKEQADRGDFMDFILRSRGEDHELTDEELVHNADLFMVAGSETTATVLLGVTYYLLQNPNAYKRATEEVRTTFKHAGDINFKEVNARLPYMLACLNEAMRIFPSIPLALLRITNDGAPTPLAGHSIPAKVRDTQIHIDLNADASRPASACTNSQPTTRPSTSTTRSPSTQSAGCRRSTTIPLRHFTTTVAMCTSRSLTGDGTASDAIWRFWRCVSSLLYYYGTST